MSNEPDGAGEEDGERTQSSNGHGSGCGLDDPKPFASREHDRRKHRDREQRCPAKERLRRQWLAPPARCLRVDDTVPQPSTDANNERRKESPSPNERPHEGKANCFSFIRAHGGT